MATYKIPQNVEAEDKLLGPLTFKQFIFFIIASVAALLAWMLFNIKPFLAIIPLPIILIFGSLAVLRREDQPIETYLLAFFNFLLRPRRRIWNPEGYYEHLVITAPKSKTQHTPRVRSPEEVHGQLEKLAQIVDTRGWVIKRPELQLPNQSGVLTGDDDRLFMPENIQEAIDIHPADDILDDTNPEAMEIDTLIKSSAQKYRQSAIAKMQASKTGTKPAGDAIPANLHFDPYPKSMHQHMLDPRSGQLSDDDAENSDDNKQNHKPAPTPGTELNSAILELAKDNELSVSQIQAQAQRKAKETGQLQEGEEISLR